MVKQFGQGFIVSEFTPEKAVAVIEAAGKGLPLTECAKMAGCAPRHLYAWMDKHPTFKAMVYKARGEVKQQAFGLIVENMESSWKDREFIATLPDLEDPPEEDSLFFDWVAQQTEILARPPKPQVIQSPPEGTRLSELFDSLFEEITVNE